MGISHGKNHELPRGGRVKNHTPGVSGDTVRHPPEFRLDWRVARVGSSGGSVPSAASPPAAPPALPSSPATSVLHETRGASTSTARSAPGTRFLPRAAAADSCAVASSFQEMPLSSYTRRAGTRARRRRATRGALAACAEGGGRQAARARRASAGGRPARLPGPRPPARKHRSPVSELRIVTTVRSPSAARSRGPTPGWGAAALGR